MNVDGIEYQNAIVGNLVVAQKAEYEVVVQVGMIKYQGVVREIDETEDTLILVKQSAFQSGENTFKTWTQIILLSSVVTVTFESKVTVTHDGD